MARRRRPPPPEPEPQARPSLCSPARYATVHRAAGTCLLPDELDALARAAAPDPHPVLEQPDAGRKARALRAALGESVGGGAASSDADWAALPAARADPALQAVFRRALRPERPRSWLRNSRQWLSSRDIDAVMVQYTASHPHFAYLGALPMDFEARDRATGACVSHAACGAHVGELLRQGKTLVGVVLNLDKHTESGSHWVACLAGLDPGVPGRFGLWYYDSVASPPTPEVRAFMRRMAGEMRAALGPAAAARFRLHWNTRRKQWENTECGVYSMLFLIVCLTTELPVPAVCAAMRGDGVTNRLRRVLFR